MQNRVIKTGAAALTAMILASAAKAEVKINDTFSTSGYVAGSYGYTDTGSTAERLDLDAAKTQFNFTTKPVTATVSLYYQPSIDSIKLLDAYATYDAGGGFTITGGNFLSYMGYEAFDIPNMDQISYASTIFAISGYHTGVKLDYADSNIGYGVAVLDSGFDAPSAFKGDGEFKNTQGFEAYVKYTGVKDVTVWSGISYDKEKLSDDIFIWDLWASYNFSKELRVAAEVDTLNKGSGTSTGWLVFADYAFSDKASIALRVSGNDIKSDNGEGGSSSDTSTKFTIAPSYTVTSNLVVRAEYSHKDVEAGTNEDFFGAQAIFKW